MRIYIIAAAFVALTAGAASANPCTNVVGDCNANGGNLSHVTTTQVNTQQQLQGQLQLQGQGQSQKAYGGAGGVGGQGGAGGNATGGDANQSQSQANQQNVNFEDRAQAPAISVNAPGLAALAASECVLSNTTSAGAGVSVAGLGIAGAFGTGNTHPYDECNTRAAIQVLGQIHGTIQGVDTMTIVGNMAAGLTGVQAAIDKAKGVQPTQGSSTSATPAAIQPEQTASLPRCSSDSLPPVTKMALGCQ